MLFFAASWLRVKSWIFFQALLTIRHWSLIEIEYCPALSSLRGWSRLLEGTLRSFNVVASWIYSKRLIALQSIFTPSNTNWKSISNLCNMIFFLLMQPLELRMGGLVWTRTKIRGKSGKRAMDWKKYPSRLCVFAWYYREPPSFLDKIDNNRYLVTNKLISEHLGI